MTPFREKKDWELAELPDEELIAYVVAAHRHGAGQSANLAMSIFANRRFLDLARRARAQDNVRWEDAEDIAHETIAATLKSAFRGEYYGEAIAFINRIFHNKLMDHYRKFKFTDELPEEQSDEERKAPDAAITGGEEDLIAVQDVVDRCLAELSPHHARVIDLYVFDGFSADETAAEVNAGFPDLDTAMSAPNVHQIAKRFRTELRRALEE